MFEIVECNGIIFLYNLLVHGLQIFVVYQSLIINQTIKNCSSESILISRYKKIVVHRCAIINQTIHSSEQKSCFILICWYN